MGDVINLREWQLKKETKKENTKQAFIDSLDNDKVKQKYKLMEKVEARNKKLSESIERINKLMKQLDEATKK